MALLYLVSEVDSASASSASADPQSHDSGRGTEVMRVLWHSMISRFCSSSIYVPVRSREAHWLRVLQYRGSTADEYVDSDSGCMHAYNMHVPALGSFQNQKIAFLILVQLFQIQLKCRNQKPFQIQNSTWVRDYFQNQIGHYFQGQKKKLTYLHLLFSSRHTNLCKFPMQAGCTFLGRVWV